MQLTRQADEAFKGLGLCSACQPPPVDPKILNKIRVISIKAEGNFLDAVVIHVNNCKEPLKVGMGLAESDSVSTGYKTVVVVDFDQKNTVVFEELTEFTISLFRLDETGQMELWLKMGGVTAQVHKKQFRPTRFTVKTPTIAISVRGTVFRVSHDEATGVSTVQVGDGEVEIAPENSTSPSFVLQVGQQVQVTQNQVGAVEIFSPGEMLARMGEESQYLGEGEPQPPVEEETQGEPQDTMGGEPPSPSADVPSLLPQSVDISVVIALAGVGILCSSGLVVIIGLVVWRGKSRIKQSPPPVVPIPKSQTPPVPPHKPQFLYPVSQANLFVTRGAASLPSISLSAEGLIIGRDPANRLALNDMEVSRHHAKLEFINGSWWITNLGTPNGTFVNGERVTHRALQHNDQIKLGQCILVFQIS